MQSPFGHHLGEYHVCLPRKPVQCSVRATTGYHTWACAQTRIASGRKGQHRLSGGEGGFLYAALVLGSGKSSSVCLFIIRHGFEFKLWSGVGIMRKTFPLESGAARRNPQAQFKTLRLVLHEKDRGPRLSMDLQLPRFVSSWVVGTITRARMSETEIGTADFSQRLGADEVPSTRQE